MRHAITGAGAIQHLIELLAKGQKWGKYKHHVPWRTLLCVTRRLAPQWSMQGAIPLLIALLAEGNGQEEAAGALCNLAQYKQNWTLIENAGGIPPVIALLKNGTDEGRHSAAYLLQRLAYNGGHSVVEAGGIEPLIALLDGKTESLRKIALDVLFNLVRYNENGEDCVDAIVHGCGLPPQVALLKNGPGEAKGAAASMLHVLSWKKTNCVAIERAGGVTQLRELLATGPVEAKDFAVGALRSLARHVQVNEASGHQCSYCGVTALHLCKCARCLTARFATQRVKRITGSNTARSAIND